ncbi:hypothetical protein [Actinoplanes sp. NBRC 103695]|uniref:hypothetical protein n=1 Tax=Actinoplanes sp. NBRC 103695 TaxID=3032202 RepID=UPI0024A2872A|nr:hypothetical protein [Actinoplanes sp. NBRC 103695]GLZ01392.1 hypothetical protein Acsp02_86430 [Actinoplanes sp. NBRC 103695]
MFSTRNVVLRLAAVGAAAVVVLGVAESAAPAPVLAAACPVRSPATPAAGSLTNGGDIAVGVFHLADGNCTHGAYDTILYPGQSTRDLGWGRVAGAYIGEPYWARVTGNGATHDYTGTDWSLDPYRGGNWTIAAVCCGGQD